MTDHAKGQLWRAETVLPRALVQAFEEALDENIGEEALSVSAFEVQATAGPAEAWRVEALFDQPPNIALLKDVLARLASREGCAEPALNTGPLPLRDWIGDGGAPLEPIRAGRYYIHDDEHMPEAAPGGIALRFNGGRAFGTGHHESTRGCLLALDALARRRQIRRPFDLGCGAGILAVATAKTWRVPVMAGDNDPAAVEVCRMNARLNGVGSLVQAVTAEGFRHPKIRRQAPYDLITANILANPLTELSEAVSRHLDARGLVVLAGLLATQESQVRAAYRSRGLVIRQRWVLNGWLTLLLGR